MTWLMRAGYDPNAQKETDNKYVFGNFQKYHVFNDKDFYQISGYLYNAKLNHEFDFYQSVSNFKLHSQSIKCQNAIKFKMPI